jgi:hypothetical protein
MFHRRREAQWGVSKGAIRIKVSHILTAGDVAIIGLMRVYITEIYLPF